jgi:hypothetical protein
VVKSPRFRAPNVLMHPHESGRGRSFRRRACFSSEAIARAIPVDTLASPRKQHADWQLAKAGSRPCVGPHSAFGRQPPMRISFLLTNSSAI